MQTVLLLTVWFCFYKTFWGLKDLSVYCTRLDQHGWAKVFLVLGMLVIYCEATMMMLILYVNLEGQ